MRRSAFSLALEACSTAPLSKSEKEEHRDSVRAMASKTLADLQRTKPEAGKAVSEAAGYAVFSDVGLKIGYMGSAKGGGIAVNNATKQETFMKMFELQPGLGLGVEKYRVVFVFETAAAFQSFVTSGKELGANAMAAAKDKTKGGAMAGAVTVSEGVYMFQVDTQGAMVGISLTGAKFYKDKEMQLYREGRDAPATGEKRSEGAPADSAGVCMAPLHDPVLSDRFRIRRAP